MGVVVADVDVVVWWCEHQSGDGEDGYSGGNGVVGLTDEVDEMTVDSSSEVDSVSSELEVGLVGNSGSY